MTHPEALGHARPHAARRRAPGRRLPLPRRQRERGDPHRHVGPRRDRRRPAAAPRARRGWSSRRAHDLPPATRTPATSPTRTSDTEGEGLLCDAREGELASFPRIWGLPDAAVEHETCLAKGGDACTYVVRWRATKPRSGPILGGGGASIVCAAAVGLASWSWAPGIIGGVLGGVLGGGAGYLWDRPARGQGVARIRAQPHRRPRARPRAEGRASGRRPGTSRAPCSAASTASGARSARAASAWSTRPSTSTLGHEVAVKVLRGAAARDGGEIARLRREAYIQVHVEHPNVVRVLDLDQMPDGSIYVVMERLVGRSLADKLARDGLLAPGFAVPVFIDVCRALARRAQEGRRPPRPQAGQHLPVRGRHRQGSRLRDEQARERRVAHAGRLHAGHARIHGARAVHRRAGRAANRYLRARRHDVRGAHGRAAHRRRRTGASSSTCTSGRSPRRCASAAPTCPSPRRSTSR